jgi:predicted Ser/Thr protein kinase
MNPDPRDDPSQAGGSTTTGADSGPGSDAYETIFARICLQRGWLTREQIVKCLHDRSVATPADSSGPRVALADLLTTQRLISRPQAEVVGEEVTRLLRDKTYSPVRQEATLGDVLVRTHQVSQEQVAEALALQGDFARRHELVPMLGEILVGKGHLTPAALAEALRLQRAMGRLRCESCGTLYLVSEIDPTKIYLCRKCAVPLRAADAVPSERVPDPGEVQRAALHARNVTGKYVIVRELGRGGMGVVYKAWDTVLKRWVALKVHAVSGGVEGLIRFRREAETSAILQHPNIVPIYDVGQVGDRHFIAMKYIEGEPLGESSLPVERACEIMIQVARAIEVAHGKDIVHRDLKPQNVLVDTSGRPYVMDFGLAKNIFESFNVTVPGTIMGSPSYMSPEQASGHTSRVDQKSDVYGLGALLYALLTGRPPFKEDTPILTVKAVIDGPVPPPTKYNPEIPAPLERIILRALSKDKARRHSSAEPFARDLERFLAGEPIPPEDRATSVSRPISTRRAAKTRMRWAVVAILLLLGALAVTLLWRGCGDLALGR